MEFLRELAEIITEIPRQHDDIIGNAAKGRPKEQSSRFLRGIRTGQYNSDHAAMLDLYGDGSHQKTYAVLKSRLRNQLLNTLFVLNPKPPEFSEKTRAFYSCQKGVFWSSVLLRFGARNLGIKIATQTLAAARKHEFTAIEFEMLYYLRGNYSLSGAEERYEEADAQLKRAFRLLEAELTSREYYERITIKFAKTSAERPELASLALQYSEHLDELRSQFENFTISLNYYRVRTLAFQVAQRYKETIAICEEAETFLHEHAEQAPTARFGEFALKKLVCYLQLRDYEQGKKTVEALAELFPVGSNNWFSYMEYFFFLLMHTQHFEEARTVFNAVVRHARYGTLPDQNRETWKIFELYLQYVLQSADTGQPTSRVIGTPKGLDRKKILRLVPTYSRDKQGYNIALLVIHILYLLDQGDLEGIIDRMAALKAYSTRYLKMSSNRQSALFFKLLLVMEANSFDYQMTKIKGEKYYIQLLNTTPNAGEFNECLQVLPFSWLWPRVLEKLKRIPT